MTRFFPASTNADYEGSLVSAWATLLLALLKIIPGGIHILLPDGGAGVIAGLDLSQNSNVIINVFAWMGASQIALGLLMVLVSLFYRSFVPVFLSVVLLEQTINALNIWVFKGAAAEHHPPGAYGAVIALPVLVALIIMSVTRRRRA